MHLEPARVRFVGSKGPRYVEIDVGAVRKLLRTDLSVQDIAREIGCEPKTLHNFIKRRNLCNLWQRRIFNGRQRAIQKFEQYPIDERPFKATKR